MAEVFDLKSELEKLSSSEKCLSENLVSEIDLEFPYQVMAGAAGFFVYVYSDYLEAPPQFFYMGYLTALGSVLARSVKVESELDTQPRLFTVLVGESATDRKSTTLNTVVKHFQSVINDFPSCWGVGSAEGLQKILKTNERSHFIQFVGKPAGTLLVFDEFKSFVNKCKIESSVLLPCVNSLFESNRYESQTKNRSVQIDDAYLSILAASTLSTYERIYDASFIDIGFPNRVFLVTGSAKRRFSFPKKIPENEINLTNENLVKVLQHVGAGCELGITSEAMKFYDEWYLNLEQSIHAKRLDTYSLRLMQLLAVNELKHKIDLKIVQQATSLCDWQLKVRKTHSPIDADNKSAKMEESIRRVLRRGPHKDRDLKRAVNANRYGLWYFETALKNLEKAHEIGWNNKEKKWLLRNT